MKKFKKLVAVSLAAVMCAAVFTSCGSGTDNSVSINENSDQPLKGVKLNMAIDAEYAPFESVNENGDIVGFDVDLNEEISKILGYEYTLNDMEFTGLISSIASKKCDYIISALTYSEERDEVVDFSDGYFTPVMAMVFKKGEDYKTMDDFKGKIVGTTLGSVYEKVVKKIDNVEMKTYDVVNEALLIIGTDELDAVLADTTNAISFCEEDDSLTYMVVPLSFTQDTVSAFSVLLPNDSPYLKYFNEAIAEIKENGTYDKLVEKWFGEQYLKDLQTAQQ